MWYMCKVCDVCDVYVMCVCGVCSAVCVMNVHCVCMCVHTIYREER